MKLSDLVQATKTVTAATLEMVAVPSSGSGSQFMVHAKGCKDVRKEIQKSSDDSLRESDLTAFSASTRSEFARKLSEDYYGDPTLELIQTLWVDKRA